MYIYVHKDIKDLYFSRCSYSQNTKTFLPIFMDGSGKPNLQQTNIPSTWPNSTTATATSTFPSYCNKLIWRDIPQPLREYLSSKIDATTTSNQRYVYIKEREKEKGISPSTTNSSSASYGVFAACDIEEWTIIGEYTGILASVGELSPLEDDNEIDNKGKDITRTNSSSTNSNSNNNNNNNGDGGKNPFLVEQQLQSGSLDSKYLHVSYKVSNSFYLS